jgi:hypothetical protein
MDKKTLCGILRREIDNLNLSDKAISKFKDHLIQGGLTDQVYSQVERLGDEQGEEFVRKYVSEELKRYNSQQVFT